MVPLARRRPASMIAAESQISPSSVRMCELMSTVLCSSVASTWISPRSSIRARGSSPAAGSSSTSTEGSWIERSPQRQPLRHPF